MTTNNLEAALAELLAGTTPPPGATLPDAPNTAVLPVGEYPQNSSGGGGISHD